MKVARYLVLFALSGGLASASLRYREEQDLRLRNANLRQTLSDIQRLRQANERLAKLSIDPEELKRLGREKSELMRLRAVQARRLTSTNQFGISARSFEFLPQDRIVTTKEGSVMLLRERTPRPSPEGGWVRAYGFVDGDVKEAFSKDGHFDEWEREHS